MNNQKTASQNSYISQKIIKPASNIAKQGINRYQSSGSMGKVIFFIILFLFIALLIYVIYIAVKSSQDAAANSPIIINDVIDAYIARPKFNLPQVTKGMNQTFSTWIYVKDWNYKFGQYKNILWKETQPAQVLQHQTL
jgi:cbb3-type cytochrome oxidase subunit 3